STRPSRSAILDDRERGEVERDDRPDLHHRPDRIRPELGQQYRARDEVEHGDRERRVERGLCRASDRDARLHVSSHMGPYTHYPPLYPLLSARASIPASPPTRCSISCCAPAASIRTAAAISISGFSAAARSGRRSISTIS